MNRSLVLSLILACSVLVPHAMARTETRIRLDPILAAIISHPQCMAKIGSIVKRIGALHTVTVIRERGSPNGCDYVLHFGPKGVNHWLKIPVVFMGGDPGRPSLFFVQDGGTEGP